MKEQFWITVFPVNTYLRIGSYTLLTAGISFLLLLFFNWIIDVKGYRQCTFPFVVIGLNPIFLFRQKIFLKV